MKTTIEKLQALDDRTFEALEAYADTIGRTWKRDLLNDFATAGTRTRFLGDWGPLQALRNSPNYGPSFVDSLTYRLIEDEAERRATRG